MEFTITPYLDEIAQHLRDNNWLPDYPLEPKPETYKLYCYLAKQRSSLQLALCGTDEERQRAQLFLRIYSDVKSVFAIYDL